MQGVLGEAEIELSAELKEASCEARWGAVAELKKELHAKLRVDLAAKINISLLSFFERQMLDSLSASLDQ